MAQRVFMIRREVLGHAADQPYVSVTGLPTVRAREAKLLDRELPRDDDRSLAPGRTVMIVEAERLPIVGGAGDQRDECGGPIANPAHVPAPLRTQYRLLLHREKHAPTGRLPVGAIPPNRHTTLAAAPLCNGRNSLHCNI